MPSDQTPTAVYRYFDADGGLLYVGVAVDFERRNQTHKCRSPWYSQVARVAVIELPSRSEALAEELRAIQTERPAHNRAHNPGRPADKAHVLKADGTLEYATTVRVPRSLLAAIDAAARKHHRSRNAMITVMLEEGLGS